MTQAQALSRYFCHSGQLQSRHPPRGGINRFCIPLTNNKLIMIHLWRWLRYEILGRRDAIEWVGINYLPRIGSYQTHQNTPHKYNVERRLEGLIWTRQKERCMNAEEQASRCTGVFDQLIVIRGSTPIIKCLSNHCDCVYSSQESLGVTPDDGSTFVFLVARYFFKVF